MTDAVALILDRHPDGVTLRQLIGGLVSPVCPRSKAQEMARHALSDGSAVVGWAGRIYAPKRATGPQPIDREPALPSSDDA